jgi:uncharacterized tellurite resistance protein B-like protein
MEQQETLLKDYSDHEKGAYFGAIASIATADHSASEEEIEHLMALADSAELSVEQKEAVRRAAVETSPDELRRCIEILRTSELRFSLVTDLISFAKADNHYSEEEKATIEGIAKQLDINRQQFSLLDEFAEKTSDVQAEPEQMQQQGFLSSLIPSGLKDKLSQSGINVGSLTKGLLGIAGPMILAGLLRRGLGGRGGGGLAGRAGGGLLGGLLGGGRGGGLGSLIGMLSGGRGFGRSGGLLGRIL